MLPFPKSRGSDRRRAQARETVDNILDSVGQNNRERQTGQAPRSRLAQVLDQSLIVYPSIPQHESEA